MIAVVAGNYRQYCDWCEATGRSPFDHSKFLYVHSARALRGVHNIDRIVYYGTWYERDDYDEVMAICDLISAEIETQNGS